MPLAKGGPPERGGKRGAPLLIRRYSTAIAFTWRRHATHYAMAEVYIYMAVNKMSNLIDFKHPQTILVYSRIKTFSSVAGIYYDDKIINVKTPKFWP